ncbi:MAG: hypothetical protein N2376_10645 [Clostridia bacterium]|nr:hypothetical protein [Clostridia bacterium]
MDTPVAQAQFKPGDYAIALVYHPPEIHPGTSVKIVKAWGDSLCAVQLPDGMLHRWFAAFELSPENPSSGQGTLSPGSYARVISNYGHGNPPHVNLGTVVRIVNCMPTIFYDVILPNGEYHRWLAESELAKTD